MTVEIDDKSGFCFGVVFAIQKAEEVLQKEGKLYCLGDIVHNNVEVERLEAKGLKTITHEELKALRNCKVLIRAHGEPPETYRIAKENNIMLIDATCPVVLRLQKNIQLGYNEANEKDGQILIYGQEGHAEVNGLVGQTEGNAIVINGLQDLDKVDYSRPVIVYSQTTQCTDGYGEILEELRNRMTAAKGCGNIDLVANDTICRQVSSRGIELQSFAQKHDVIIFVSGKKSSNGRILFDQCKKVNPYTYFVSSMADLKKGLFISASSVGVCGATSTPRWLMEKIANEIRNW
jgi:4-hydroxy-3-methylbut-2-en-1-yl diphosphate reductase